MYLECVLGCVSDISRWTRALTLLVASTADVFSGGRSYLRTHEVRGLPLHPHQPTQLLVLSVPGLITSPQQNTNSSWSLSLWSQPLASLTVETDSESGLDAEGEFRASDKPRAVSSLKVFFSHIWSRGFPEHSLAMSPSRTSQTTTTRRLNVVEQHRS